MHYKSNYSVHFQIYTIMSFQMKTLSTTNKKRQIIPAIQPFNIIITDD